MRWDTDEGSTTTELVLILPAVLLVILLAVQFGLWLHAAQVVEAAAQQGLEAAQAEDGSAFAGQAAANGFLAEAGGVRDPSTAATRDTQTAGVTVRAAAPEVVPGVELAVSAAASGPVERFIAEDQR